MDILFLHVSVIVELLQMLFILLWYPVVAKVAESVDHLSMDTDGQDFILLGVT